MIKSALLAALGFIATSAIAQQPQSFEAGQTKKVTGTIEAVSQSDRHVVVLDNTGRRLILEADETVGNLEQLNQGDRIVVAYHEGLIADIVPPGQGGESMTERTERLDGGMPTKVVGKQKTSTVEIESVDPDRNLVTFKDRDGMSRTLGVSNSKAKEFVSQLSPGDQVQLTYREAAAFSIQPAGGRLSSADDVSDDEESPTKYGLDERCRARRVATSADAGDSSNVDRSRRDQSVCVRGNTTFTSSTSILPGSST